MVKCSEIMRHIEKYAPACLAAEWDNCGLQVGDSGQDIKKILVSLDINKDVINEAVKKNAGMIVTHHPLLFRPVKSIDKSEAKGDLIHLLIKNNISCYSAHTNMDFAEGGTNDALANAIGLKNIRAVEETYQNGRIGEIQKPVELKEFIEEIETRLKIKGTRVAGYVSNIKTAAVSAGSYDRSILQYIKGKADVLVTGDLKYHDARDIIDAGLCAVDIGHYASEKIVVDVLAECLSELDVEVVVSEVELEPFKKLD